MDSISLSTQNGGTLEETSIAVAENNGIQTVSARDLYKRLEITDRFNRWFESICKYGFYENEDFTSVKTSTLVNNGAERELDDYAISIEMAKQICMLQRSDKGKLYREYFLKLERAWNSPEAVMSRALQIANRTLEDAKRKIEVQQKQIEVMTPKAIVYDEFVSRDKFCNFRDGSNYLHMKQSEFMTLLKSKYIYKNESGEYRCYAEYSEYFTLRPFTRGDKTRQQLMLSIRGLEFFKGKIQEK